MWRKEPLLLPWLRGRNVAQRALLLPWLRENVAQRALLIPCVWEECDTESPPAPVCVTDNVAQRALLLPCVGRRSEG